jgi:hypothetical protein
MSRSIYAFAAAAALVMAPAVFAANTVNAENTANTIRDTRETSLFILAARAELAALFATPAHPEVVETEDGVMAPQGPMEVVLARIGSDGKVIMTCVDDEKAAQRFLEAPIEKIGGQNRREQ